MIFHGWSTSLFHAAQQWVKRNGDNTGGVLRSFGVRKIKEDRCAAQRGAAQR